MDNIHILGIPGSLRTGSYNRALLVNAQQLLPAGTTLEIFDLHDIPLYNWDVEKEGVPEAVLTFRDAIFRADALLIATPEYNYSVPGVLKNGIDWASRSKPDGYSPLNGKPLAMIGAGGMMGTVRAQDHLRSILLHNDLKIMNRPALMLARGGRYFDEDGWLVDEEIRERLQNVLVGLRDWAQLFIHSPVALGG